MFYDFNKVLNKNNKKYINFLKHLGNQIINFHFDEIINKNLILKCELNKKKDIIEEDPRDQRDAEIIRINDIEIRFFLKSKGDSIIGLSQLRSDFIIDFIDKQVQQRKNKYQLPYTNFLKEMSNFINKIKPVSDLKLQNLNNHKKTINTGNRKGKNIEITVDIDQFPIKVLKDVKEKCRLITEEIFSIFRNLKFDYDHRQRSKIYDYFRLLNEIEIKIEDIFNYANNLSDKKDNERYFNLYLKFIDIGYHLDIYEKSLISIFFQIEKLFLYNFISNIFKKDNQIEKNNDFFLKQNFLFLLGIDENKINFSTFYDLNISEFNEDLYKTKEGSNYFTQQLLNSYKGFKYIVSDLISVNSNHFDDLKFLPFPLFNKLALPKELSQEIIHLGPARPGSKRFYTAEDIDNLNPSDVAYILKLQDHKNPGFINRLNEVCNSIDFLDNIKTAPVKDRSLDAKKIEVKTPGSKTFVNIADTGYGLSQLLPIVLNSILKENQTILIQQPETHLHPRLQAEVGTLMVNSLKFNSFKNWIVETHSEILLLRILKKIRIGELDSNKLRVYYIDQKKDKGSYIKRMFVSKNGELITKWPLGFFSNDIDEIFDI